MLSSDGSAFLTGLFRTAVASADPARVIARYLPAPPRGRTIVLGAGKASAAMARAVEDAWSGPLEGLVVTRYGHGVPCQHIEIVEAAHPVPDQAGRDAAGRILEIAQSAGPDDLVLFLISGGGSSLLTLPAEPFTLADKQAVNEALLRSGASIGEMNCVRKHMSAIKGGRLQEAAAPARTVTLTISDVPGDDPAVIASGPTVPDGTTSAEALAILERNAVPMSEKMRAWLRSAESESPKPGDPAFRNLDVRMIATPQMALEAAAGEAGKAGFAVHILGDAIEGEARDVAAVHAAIVKQIVSRGQPFQAPCVLLSGGETTVTVRGGGRGGRNVEFLLALALALDGAADVYALACDTDGVDGAEEVAGAVVGPDTLRRAGTLGLDVRAALDDNDAHRFFEALGDQVITGPTLTNVNDFRAILIGGCDPSRARTGESL